MQPRDVPDVDVRTVRRDGVGGGFGAGEEGVESSDGGVERFRVRDLVDDGAEDEPVANVSARVGIGERGGVRRVDGREVEGCDAVLGVLGEPGPGGFFGKRLGGAVGL